tara:strand:+ start:15746 stop:16096 length:351 start_codon:yes stop_codon:yes gene_type:complete
MAKLSTMESYEALNASTGVGGQWSVKSAVTAGSSADVTNTQHIEVDTDTAQLGILSDVEIYFNFSITQTDITTAKDLKLPKGTLTFITIPRGLGNVIYFNILSTTSTTGSVRIVEI